MNYLDKLEDGISAWPNVSVHSHRFGGRKSRFGSAIATINSEPDMEMVANRRERKSRSRPLSPVPAGHRPDGLKMREMGGVEEIRAIRTHFPSAKIVVLSTYESDEDVYRALQAGAVTYLLKNTRSEKMISVIREVAGGGPPVPPEVA